MQSVVLVGACGEGMFIAGTAEFLSNLFFLLKLNIFFIESHNIKLKTYLFAFTIFAIRWYLVNLDCN